MASLGASGLFEPFSMYAKLNRKVAIPRSARPSAFDVIALCVMPVTGAVREKIERARFGRSQHQRRGRLVPRR